MPRMLAATQENNAWRSRKRVVADYVPECMHHHVNDKAVAAPVFACDDEAGEKAAAETNRAESHHDDELQ